MHLQHPVYPFIHQWTWGCFCLLLLRTVAFNSLNELCNFFYFLRHNHQTPADMFCLSCTVSLKQGCVPFPDGKLTTYAPILSVHTQRPHYCGQCARKGPCGWGQAGQPSRTWPRPGTTSHSARPAGATHSQLCSSVQSTCSERTQSLSVGPRSSSPAPVSRLRP